MVSRGLNSGSVRLRRGGLGGPYSRIDQSLRGAASSSPDNQRVVLEECFRLLEAPNQNVAATLITKNFGADEVRIRRANLMCEPAKKTILFDNPNEPAPPDDAIN